MYEIKIPKLRVGCLVGKKGETKKLIERSTKTKIKVSSEGDVEISGDSFGAYVCEKVVRAVGRGFNPNIAMNLVREDYGFEVLDINDYTGRNKNNLFRIRARLIGTRGKARRVIEKITECNICVYGKTVSVIGEVNKLNIAFRGIQKLLQGSIHSNVYGFLEKEVAKLRR